MPWTERYLGALGEDRYHIPPSSVKDSVQDKEWKRKIRQGHEEFPCTSTRAAKKLEADQKRWGEVMPCFFGGVGRPKESRHTHPKGTQKTASWYRIRLLGEPRVVLG